MKKLLNIKYLALLFSTALIAGCAKEEFRLFDPKGPIAEQEMWLIIISAAIMLLVVIPVTVMGVWYPIRYRSSAKNREYKPDWEHSTKIEVTVWLVPILMIITLGIITYITSFSLDPRKPIESDKPTKVIQVVAMNWKWLFIYPEEQIATINEIAIPVDQPVEFLITSDATMNSFFIPNLGTQIYAMAGMENRLHLMADEEGVYPGMSANYSGFGFSGMKFNTHVVSDQGYQEWVNKVKSSPNALSDEAFEKLREKSRDVPPAHYNSVNPLLFTNIIKHYTGDLYGE